MKTCKKRLSAAKPLLLCGVITLLSFVGCSGSSINRKPSDSNDPVSIKRVRLSTSTGFEPDPAGGVRLKALVELFDAYDSQIQKPAVFRFELYEFRRLSRDPRGHRLMLWPNQDLMAEQAHAAHWRDYLGGYEFFLPSPPDLSPGRKYVLEVTCMVDNKRHMDRLKFIYD